MVHFDNLYRHGFVRVSAFAPKVHAANPKANLDEILSCVQQADKASAGLAVFPELSLTGYALDDLHQQDSLLKAAEAAAAELIKQSTQYMPVIIVGAPVRQRSQLFNCAIVIHRGRLLGVVPKSFLPNYREFYEKRWFSDARAVMDDTIHYAGQDTAFGTGLLFEADDVDHFLIHVEICEDLWAPTPPSIDGALAGGTVMVNLSASNATIGKSRERAALCDVQSRRCCGAYLFTAAGLGESTTDLAWDGQLSLFELGDQLAVSERFEAEGSSLFSEIDLDRIQQDRIRLATFGDAASRSADRLRSFRRIGFALNPPLKKTLGLLRSIDRFPFVPDDPDRLDEDCFEAYNIQVTSLAQRLSATGIQKAVIGVSGGLDSTQALIVTTRAFDRLGRDRSDILAVTLPGYATSDETRANALTLIRGLGVTHKEIDIRPAADQMLADIDHPYSDGEAEYDVTFENVQAGLRTDYLFRLANHVGGMVIGTGDLSELSLGWCTYGVGDHMSHYTVNSGVAKTLIQHLINWSADRGQFGDEVSACLKRILATEISPELVPADASGIQSTQSIIGPYPLQDFNLHYAVRYGFGPEKIAFLASQAWGPDAQGDWPSHVPEADRESYDLATVIKWLEVFIQRFYQQSQYKRSAIPNGPKVTSAGALNPRGDWRMPSDSAATVWLDELKALKAELKLP